MQVINFFDNIYQFSKNLIFIPKENLKYLKKILKNLKVKNILKKIK